MMFCVIQEIERKRNDRRGYYKELYSTYDYHNGSRKYRYYFGGGRFDRPIRTAYKISIHVSRRENGKVKKEQYVVGTVGYYDIAEWNTEDEPPFDTDKVEYIADSLNVDSGDLYYLIYDKLNPYNDRIKAEFEQTAEYETYVNHDLLIFDYECAKRDFTNMYGCNNDIYDYIFDVFGQLKNKVLFDKITYKPPKSKKTMLNEFQEALRKHYRNGELSDSEMTTINRIWNGLIKKTSYTTSARYTAADRAVLKKVYRMLAKAYHSDVTHDDEAMKFINELRQYWGK